MPFNEKRDEVIREFFITDLNTNITYFFKSYKSVYEFSKKLESCELFILDIEAPYDNNTFTHYCCISLWSK